MTDTTTLPPLPEPSMRAAPPEHERWPFPKVGYFTAEQMQAYALAALAQSAQAPIDMVLHCPVCGMQHIDASEPARLCKDGAACSDYPCSKCDRWTNPPHRSHLCHGCGHIWRPADVPTNGVRATKTTGKADSQIQEGHWAQSAQAPDDETIGDFLAERMTPEGRVPMVKTIRDALLKWGAAQSAQAPAQPEPCRPDLLERLSYHALERDDLTLDEVLEALASGWKKVQGRSERQMLLQLLDLLASRPAAPPAPAQPAPPVEAVMTLAARDVLVERRRQVEAEGWTPEHDDEHHGGEMARAAAAYALIGSTDGRVVGDELEPSLVTRVWPWAPEWWKPKDRRRNLIRAAALILAEIERLDRAEALARGSAVMGEQHTPGPFKVGAPFVWHRRECLPIIRVDFPRLTLAVVMSAHQDVDLTDAERVDAARIVHCLNLHDEMLAALTAAEAVIRRTCGHNESMYLEPVCAVIAKATQWGAK